MKRILPSTNQNPIQKLKPTLGRCRRVSGLGSVLKGDTMNWYVVEITEHDDDAKDLVEMTVYLKAKDCFNAVALATKAYQTSVTSEESMTWLSLTVRRESDAELFVD